MQRAAADDSRKGHPRERRFGCGYRHAIRESASPLASMLLTLLQTESVYTSIAPRSQAGSLRSADFSAATFSAPIRVVTSS